MSVINTMLKDLENRGGASEAAREPVLQGLGSGGGASYRRTGTLLIGAAGVASTLALLLAVYLLSPYRLVSDADMSAQSVAAMPAQSTVQNADATEHEEAAPVTVASAGTSEVQEAKPESKPAHAGNRTTTSQSGSEPERKAREDAAAVAAKSPAPSVAREPVPAVTTASKTQRVQANEPVAQNLQARPAAAAPAAKSARIAVAQDAIATGMQEDEVDDEAQLVVTKKQRALTGREQSTQAYAIALKHYKQGDRQQAKVLLREALAHDRENIAARRLLAGIHLETGQPELARETIEAGLRKNGSDEELLRLYLQASVHLGNYARAIEVMRQLRPSTPDEYGYLAGLYQKNNDHRNAVNYYSQALQIKPDQSVWWMGQGISLEALGKYNEALQSYTQSVKAGRLTTQLTDFVANRIISIEQKLEPRES